MPKLLNMVISDCCACPHMHDDSYYGDMCFHPTVQENWDPEVEQWAPTLAGDAGNGIPKWCPLPPEPPEIEEQR
jgi:hypothetical protein